MRCTAASSRCADLHCDAPVPAVGDGLPPGLDRFFERALAKRPEQRWRTALELAAALRADDLRALLASAPGDVAARVADAAGAGAIVVAIDQLEELFTLGASAGERAQFAAAVAGLAASGDLTDQVPRCEFP